MDMSYLASSFYLLMGLGSGLYLLFYALFRKSIVSFSDPLNYTGLVVVLYLAGALVLPSVFDVNRSYVYVIILVTLYVVAGAFCSKPSIPDSPPRLATDRGSQLLFTSILTGLICTNLVVNQIFGVMPLFQGTQARAEYGSVVAPTLYFLSPDLGHLALLAFLLTEVKRVRLAAGIGVVASFMSTMLSGSKSGLFSLALIFFSVDYILNLRRLASPSASQRIALTKRIKILRRRGAAGGIGIVALMPAYLAFIGATSSGGAKEAFTAMATRLFGGFDALAIIVVKNIDITAVHGVNISGFYFYPFLKKLSLTPEFQSAGLYLIYLLSDSYQNALSGLNPNSTFPIELLLSNGSLALSGALTILAVAVVFRIRAAVIKRGALRMFDLVLWVLVVFGPFSILIDGAYFVIRSYELIAVYMAIDIVINAITWINPGKKVFRLL